MKKRLSAAVIACAVLALALRLFQLSPSGPPFRFTQYDDGMYFGNAVRLVHLAIAFRASPEEPSPGTARCPGRNATGGS